MEQEESTKPKLKPLKNYFIFALNAIHAGIEFFGKHPFVTGIMALLSIAGLSISIIGFELDRQDAELTSRQVENVDQRIDQIFEILLGSESRQQVHKKLPYHAVLKNINSKGFTIYKKPSKDSEKLARILAGSNIEILKLHEDIERKIWLKIKIKEGWIAERNVITSKKAMLMPLGSENLEPGSLAIVSYPRSDGLNLRVSPDIRSDIIATFLKESILTIKSTPEINQDRIWRIVQFSVGWVFAGNSVKEAKEKLITK